MIFDLPPYLVFPPLLLIFVVFTLMGQGGSTGKPRHRKHQLAELDTVLSSASGRAELVVDWMRFTEIDKLELVEAFGKRGLRLDGQEIVGREWRLRFTKQPASAGESGAERPQPIVDSRTRLRRELTSAQAGVDGTYILDVGRYQDIPSEELTRAIESAGWRRVRVSDAGMNAVAIARPGAETVHAGHGPFLEGPSLAELRAHPQVVERARVITREHGFDPLDDNNLDTARQRHKYWARRFNKHVGLAFLFGILMFLGLGITFRSFEPADGEGFYISLAVTLAMVALFVLVFTKAALIRKRRWAEIGATVTAYKELSTLAEKPDDSS
nr:hypothetical protein [Kibdelosporangium sp. MJ126-NF4]CEL15541.1 hypothetical protein [Kibdelosporangium sp. MJ126-NF4]CTQ98207.1 hypothetical protein [Kibdelosporangium sp. MJ126-NF4]